MLSHSDANINAPQALCLAPARELARQIYDVVVAMGKFTKLQTQLVVKDMDCMLI
jgi:ATP-dependent RNA helicase DDX19/DBP5